MWSGGDRSGLLTVKNVYTTITNSLWQINIGGWRKNLWSWNIAQKIKLFTWLTIENKIHTWDNLQRKGWVGPNICQLCYSDEETVMHLFIKCPFTRQVWDIITLDQNLNTIWEGTTISACYDYWSTRECNLKHLPSLVYWFIWLDRNKKFFENGTPSTSIVAYKTLGMLKNWKYIHLSKVVNQIKNRTLNTEDTPTGWFMEQRSPMAHKVEQEA
jgi:hypothetical protein